MISQVLLLLISDEHHLKYFDRWKFQLVFRKSRWSSLISCIFLIAIMYISLLISSAGSYRVSPMCAIMLEWFCSAGLLLVFLQVPSIESNENCAKWILCLEIPWTMFRTLFMPLYTDWISVRACSKQSSEREFVKVCKIDDKFELQLPPNCFGQISFNRWHLSQKKWILGRLILYAIPSITTQCHPLASIATTEM